MAEQEKPEEIQSFDQTEDQAMQRPLYGEDRGGNQPDVAGVV